MSSQDKKVSFSCERERLFPEKEGVEEERQTQNIRRKLFAFICCATAAAVIGIPVYHLYGEGSPSDPKTQPCNAVHNLLVAVRHYLNTGHSPYGDAIDTWCVENIRDFNAVFKGVFPDPSPNAGPPVNVNSFFNQRISSWNVSGAHSMRSMFAWALHFNQDISIWDVSRVVDTSEMFEGASSFNQDLSMWVTSSITDMSKMFWGASAFRQDIYCPGMCPACKT